MSLIKGQSKEDNYRRDSFSVRICDDLCQFILNYLSLEDRLKLECVSKQFRRTVFHSQYSIELDVEEETKVIKALMKKLPNLNHILLYADNYQEVSISMDLIEAIIENCNHLTHIEFAYEVYMKKAVLKKFFGNFGHKLLSLIISSDSIALTSTEAPNVEELTIGSFNKSDLTQTEFKRLKRFTIEWLSTKDLDSFEKFIENNAKTLKHLDINFVDIDNEESAQRFFKIISKSINLVHLAIYSNFSFETPIYDKSFAEYWNQIAINCKQIKSLKLVFNEYESQRLNDEILPILRSFKGLKRLNLSLIHTLFDETIIDFHPIQVLKGLEQLTHLRIRLDGHLSVYETFSDTILNGIDINFPKLRILIIENQFKASIWTTRILRRMSRLEKIALTITNPEEIATEIERQLIRNCKKFKTFKVIQFKIAI